VLNPGAVLGEVCIDRRVAGADDDDRDTASNEPATAW
jgi:hypothetical protein